MSEYAAYVAEYTPKRGVPLLYGYGETLPEVTRDVNKQITGATSSMRRVIWDHITIIGVDPDLASEVAEMLACDNVIWGNH